MKTMRWINPPKEGGKARDIGNYLYLAFLVASVTAAVSAVGCMIAFGEEELIGPKFFITWVIMAIATLIFMLRHLHDDS